MNQLNLPEFKVIEVQSNNHDLLFTVEAVESPIACYECGSVSYYKHGKTDRFVRDLSTFGKRVDITIQGHRYKCRDCNATFSEVYNSIDERDKMTIRLREHIKLQSLKQPFSNIAEEYSISPTTVKPRFGEQEFTIMNRFTLTGYGSFNFTEPTLEEGFGVSIPQLLTVIERDDF